MSEDRLERIEDRVDKIEDAIIELKLSIGSIVSEMKMIRYAIFAAASMLGIDLSGMV